MIIRRMMADKEPCDEIKRVLIEINSNHIDLDKLNRILWIITGENRELIQTLEKQDKIGEIRLIRNIQNTLNICKFSIPNRWMEEEIYQIRLKLIELLK
jgi:acyl-CoA hydrolase